MCVSFNLQDCLCVQEHDDFLDLVYFLIGLFHLIR